MKILYIDTSSKFLYSGIVEGNKVLTEVKKEFGQNLSQEALPEIAEMFSKVNLNPNAIEKIIVVNGPGSFTGIRIGITIAKVYAWSLNIPITTITSLEAMMISSQEENTNYVPLIDARREYVFGAIYNSKKQEILKPQHIKINELEEKIKKLEKFTIITNDELEIFSNKEPYIPNIGKIVNSFKDKSAINPHAVNPEYLKLTEAEESKLS